MRSAAEWVRIRMTGTSLSVEDIRIRNLPYEDFIAEVQQDAYDSRIPDLNASIAKANEESRSSVCPESFWP